MNRDLNASDLREKDPSAGGARSSSPPNKFATIASSDGYTDGRNAWDWKSKYPAEARSGLTLEAVFLIVSFAVFATLTGFFLGLAGQTLQFSLEASRGMVAGAAGPLVVSVDFRLLALFFSGSMGGVTFSIKWLVHSAAKGTWHLDRRYWRLLVPFLGGAYACVVLTLFDAGFLNGSHAAADLRPIAISAAFAFLVGYFSDGVSGLLSNVANSVFGTLDKK